MPALSREGLETPPSGPATGLPTHRNAAVTVAGLCRTLTGFATQTGSICGCREHSRAVTRLESPTRSRLGVECAGGTAKPTAVNQFEKRSVEGRSTNRMQGHGSPG